MFNNESCLCFTIITYLLPLDWLSVGLSSLGIN
jgi:hypothetical protein